MTRSPDARMPNSESPPPRLEPPAATADNPNHDSRIPNPESRIPSPEPRPAGVLEHVDCPICGPGEVDVVYEARHDREKDADPVEKFRASGDELLIDRLVRCRRCTLQYVSPRLRAEVILAGYEGGEDPAYVSQLRARERTFAGALAGIERAAGGRGRLLDVGTAAGAFVAAARAAGWDAEGCEPNRWLAEWGAAHYGIRIRSGDIFGQPYEPASFDVVTLWDVIEHTANPIDVLQRCRRLLRPGGVLVVNYPDIGSWIARVMGRRWLFLTSVHLWYFDRRTMALALAKAGYRVERMRPHLQRLELDYILFRGSVLNAPLSAAARKAASMARLGGVQVPYWLGQTFVLARKPYA